MTPQILYRLQADLAPHFAHLGYWQLQGLLLSVLGLVKKQGCQFSGMAESLTAFGRPDTVKKRLKRWLENPRIKDINLSYAWMRWVFARFPSKRPVLLVDETRLGPHIGIMMVSLAYERRAIPLLWRCYIGNSKANYPQQGQVLLIYGLLAHVVTCVPANQRPLVQMDRGLSHSSAMLNALNALGVDYLVRIKADAKFTTRKGLCRRLSTLIQPGGSFSARGHLFSTCPVSGYVRLIWDSDQKQAWCLFTNVRWLSGRAYAMRWWQEESFKDLKSGGWQLQQTKLRDPRRLHRHLFVMALAYAWMISLGTYVVTAPISIQRRVATLDDLRRYSIFRLGLRWFNYLIEICPPKLRFQLTFKRAVLQLRR